MRTASRAPHIGAGVQLEAAAPSAGFEPAHMAPEATALSPELRGLGERGYQRLASIGRPRQLGLLRRRSAEPPPTRPELRGLGERGYQRLASLCRPRPLGLLPPRVPGPPPAPPLPTPAPRRPLNPPRSPTA